MNARQFLRKHSIFVAIAFTILFIGISALLTFYGRYQVKHFNNTKEQVERAIAKLDNLFAYLNEMDKGVRGFLVIPDDQFLLPYHTTGETIYQNFDTLQTILEAQDFTDTEGFAKSKATLTEYYEGTLAKIIDLQKQGHKDEALAIYQTDPGMSVFVTCFKFANGVRAFEQQRYEKAKARYQYHLDVAAWMQALLLLVGVPTLIFVIHQIKKSEKLRRQLFYDLSESRRRYLFDDKTKLDKQHEKHLIDHLIADLEKAAGFVQRISQGDYSVTWEGMNEDNRDANQENLAGALIHMREQMKVVKQEDQQRLWTTEGVSKVAEITRQHQEDRQLLADSLLAYLVTYTEANQGSLFFLQEDELGNQTLTLAACYAYDKKKHGEKTVQAGQGLVGQTYLEKKTMHMTQVPDQYVSITSGLGEATPNTLLLVPLTFGGQVMGVLEIAAFSPFQAYRIAFLESVGEIIASAVATVRMNSQTKLLLTQAQESTEALRAQEEEMRQNMEELQATQEEMQRKAQEYEAVIEEQQAKITRLEQV